MKAKIFKKVPIKPQTEYASREEYPDGGCVACYNCGDGRTIEHFPDDPTQPDGLSPFCDRCDSRVRQAIATQDFEGQNKAPKETRAQVSARMRRAAAMAADEVKAEPTFDMTPPDEDLSDGPVSDGEDADDEIPDGDQGETLNSGEVTAGASLVIESEGLDLAEIPGRSSDGKVGMPEIDAWKVNQELHEDQGQEDQD